MQTVIYVISFCLGWLHALLFMAFLVYYYRSKKLREKKLALGAMIYLFFEIITNIFILKIGGII